jgi:hypothetical protein
MGIPPNNLTSTLSPIAFSAEFVTRVLILFEAKVLSVVRTNCTQVTLSHIRAFSQRALAREVIGDLGGGFFPTNGASSSTVAREIF